MDSSPGSSATHDTSAATTNLIHFPTRPVRAPLNSKHTPSIVGTSVVTGSFPPPSFDPSVPPSIKRKPIPGLPVVHDQVTSAQSILGPKGLAPQFSFVNMKQLSDPPVLSKPRGSSRDPAKRTRPVFTQVLRSVDYTDVERPGTTMKTFKSGTNRSSKAAPSVPSGREIPVRSSTRTTDSSDVTAVNLSRGTPPSPVDLGTINGSTYHKLAYRNDRSDSISSRASDDSTIVTFHHDPSSYKTASVDGDSPPASFLIPDFDWKEREACGNWSIGSWGVT